MVSATSLLCAVAAFAASAVVKAQELPFTLGEPVFFGSGCPKDSVAVVPSTDGKTFSVLFSEFAAETSREHLRERKSCNLAVNMDVKPGFTVAVAKVDYRGNVYVPAGAPHRTHAHFSAEYFFAGSAGSKVSYRYSPGADRDLYLSNTVAALSWSPCGQSTNLRINAQVTANKVHADNEDVQIAIDSTDANLGGFRYYYVYKRC